MYSSVQLSPFSQSPDEYGLNVSADVALWMESRTYNEPPIHEFCDMVIVTPELHDEFDLFKEKETTPRESIFPLNRFLQQ